MSILDENWFWLILCGVVFLISFLLVYLEEKFSTPAILLLVLFAITFVLILIVLFAKRATSDIQRTGNLITNLIIPNKEAQKAYMRVTLDALSKAGNTGLLLTKTTMQTALPAFGKAYASGIKDVAKNVLVPF